MLSMSPLIVAVPPSVPTFKDLATVKLPVHVVSGESIVTFSAASTVAVLHLIMTVPDAALVSIVSVLLPLLYSMIVPSGYFVMS